MDLVLLALRQFLLPRYDLAQLSYQRFLSMYAYRFRLLLGGRERLFDLLGLHEFALLEVYQSYVLELGNQLPFLLLVVLVCDELNL